MEVIHLLDKNIPKHIILKCNTSAHMLQDLQPHVSEFRDLCGRTTLPLNSHQILDTVASPDVVIHLQLVEEQVAHMPTRGEFVLIAQDTGVFIQFSFETGVLVSEDGDGRR